MKAVDARADEVAVSPVVLIEQDVLQRAKVERVDAADVSATTRVRALVEQAVADWQDAAVNGRRAFPLPDPNAVVDRVTRNLLGYGPLAALLDDEDVWEIMINAPDQIFVKRHRGMSGYHDDAFHDQEHVVRTLTKILGDAAGAHRKFDPAEGLQDAQLDDGSRMHIVHADVGRGGNVLVNIRRFTGVAYRTLDELVEVGTLTAPAAAFLRAAVRARLSIVFAGPPGSGKTTLLSCCAAELDPGLRVVTGEEVFELDVPLSNVASMQTRAARPDRPEIDLRRLVAGFLRMAPDVAVVGEVRDREALSLLLTLSSGVTGFTTIHAGSARKALSRLRFVCQLADTRSELPVTALNALVTDSVDLVVHADRREGLPVVREIVAVEEQQSDASGAAFTVTEVFGRQGGPLTWTGAMPVRAASRMREVGIDPVALLAGDARSISEQVDT
jgi:pilus assembly protein CpaF